MPGDVLPVVRLFMIKLHIGKKYLSILTIMMIIIIFGFVGKARQPYLFIETEQGIYQTIPVKAGATLSLSFIHSVQRTPVIENFIIEDSFTLTLDSTEYQSLGVGLPFLAEDGKLQAENGKFVMSGMNRPHQRLSLRIWPETRLSLTYAETTIPVYSLFPAGTLVTVWVGPLYSNWF